VPDAEMKKQIETQAVEQIQAVVCTELACQVTRSDGDSTWVFQANGPEISSATLKLSGERLELVVTLASTAGVTRAAAVELWRIVAGLQTGTDRAGTVFGPIEARNGCFELPVKLELHNAPLDLPRLTKLRQALRAVREAGAALRALPGFGNPSPQAQIPPELADYLMPFEARAYPDTGTGSCADVIGRRLGAGLPLALVAPPLRVQLELDRIAARTPAALTMPRGVVRVDELPRLLCAMRPYDLVLAMHSSLLRASMSVYEMGRDLDALFHQLRGLDVGLILHGTREELESALGVGQGRTFSPLYPLLETLAPAAPVDLAWCALGRHGIARQNRGPDLGALLVDVITAEADGTFDERYVTPLAATAAKLGPGHAELADRLHAQVCDLTGSRDTLGTVGDGSATPRPPWLQERLHDRLRGNAFEQFLKRALVGQDRAVVEFAARVFQETVSRPPTAPLRVLQAGPPGTGKSLGAKLLAEYLDLAYHYIDAAGYSSSHSVMASLTGAAPGLVSSYQDGTLARIARRPAVLEIADLDHAPPDVRQALTDCSLRLLQEGTLQAGSGATIRSLSSVIFIYTSNIAYADQGGPVRQFGFGQRAPSPAEVCERVRERMIRELGYAFVSRVGEPIVYVEFTPESAAALAQREIRQLVARTTRAASVEVPDEAAALVVESMPNFAGGARRIMDEVHKWIVPALGELNDERGQALEVVRAGRAQLIVRRKEG
nr:AAA family ATPase [Phycisphaerae bacterium]